MRRLALLVALTLAATPLVAATKAEPTVIKDVPKFLNYQRDLRDDMQKDPKFKHVDRASKQRLYDAQDTLFTLLEGKKSIEDLDDAQKIEAYNAQAEIAAVITDAELDRPVCRREKRIGSNRAETVCETKRSMEERRNAAQGALRGPRACSGDLCKAN